MKFCPSCGNQLVDEANFCNKCGAQQNALQQSQQFHQNPQTTHQQNTVPSQPQQYYVQQPNFQQQQRSNVFSQQQFFNTTQINYYDAIISSSLAAYGVVNLPLGNSIALPILYGYGTLYLFRDKIVFKPWLGIIVKDSVIINFSEIQYIKKVFANLNIYTNDCNCITINEGLGFYGQFNTLFKQMLGHLII